MQASGKTEIIVVIPIFDPPADLATRVEELLRQASRVIVVDDNPQRGSAWAPNSTSDAVLVLKHETNRGIAAALNTGVREALKSPNVTHIITLDEDSRLDRGYVDVCLNQEVVRAASGARIGILCPETMDHNPVAARSGVRNEPFDPMQSGMFIPIETFDRIGLFDETLFIDAVDSDFTLRARGNGLTVEFAPNTDLSHSLGKKVPAKLFGRVLRWRGSTKEFSSHSPIRLYYITRNHLRVNLRFAREDPMWVLRRSLEDIKLLTINSVFGSHREKALLAILIGALHGAIGRSGKIPQAVASRLVSRSNEN